MLDQTQKYIHSYFILLGIRDDRSDPGRKRQFGNAGPSKRGEATFEGVPIQDIPGLNTLDSETVESLGNGEVGPKLFV